VKIAIQRHARFIDIQTISKTKFGSIVLNMPSLTVFVGAVVDFGQVLAHLILVCMVRVGCVRIAMNLSIKMGDGYTSFRGVGGLLPDGGGDGNDLRHRQV